jgi:hypothetical protein
MGASLLLWLNAWAAPALQVILIAAEILRGNPALTLAQAGAQLGTRLNTECSASQLELAVLISVRTMLKFDCPGKGTEWKRGESFVGFASRCFPTTSYASVAAVKQAIEGQRSMKAWKLKTKFQLSFKGTGDLARHLHLDLSHSKGPRLYLFWHLAFIQAQLGDLERDKVHKEAELPACLVRYIVLSILSSPIAFPSFEP